VRFLLSQDDDARELFDDAVDPEMTKSRVMNDHYCKSTDHVYTEIFILPTGVRRVLWPTTTPQSS